MCTYVQKHQKLVWCQADGADVVTGALLFLLEFCVSAFLPSRQRSPLPAGQGSHRSDLHLREVEGCQVALPRFPVHPLTAKTADWERSWLGQSREEEKCRMFRQESHNERGRQRAERSSRERGKWHDRQAEWHAVINTYRCFISCEYKLVLTVIAFCRQTLQETSAMAILWMKSRQEQRNPLAFPSVSVFLRHNNCCCYPSSLVKTLMVYSWCEKCVFLSLLMDVGHFCFTSTIQNK